jgi:hypothetical protein
MSTAPIPHDTPVKLAPWIDAAELDDLERRCPNVSRATLASILERHWPYKEDVDRAVADLAGPDQAR